MNFMYLQLSSREIQGPKTNTSETEFGSDASEIHRAASRSLQNPMHDRSAIALILEVTGALSSATV